MMSMRCKVLTVLMGMGLGLSASCTTEKSCTTIGCTDRLSLILVRPDGSEPHFEISLVVDGKSIACPAPALGGSSKCDDGVFVSLSEGQVCRQDETATAATLRCTGNGRFQEVVEIQSPPTAVTVSLAQGGETKSLGTFSPTYQTMQPNGPGCEPVCRQAEITQVVDLWP
jgi:hypothetical protein